MLALDYNPNYKNMLRLDMIRYMIEQINGGVSVSCANSTILCTGDRGTEEVCKGENTILIR